MKISQIGIYRRMKESRMNVLSTLEIQLSEPKLSRKNRLTQRPTFLCRIPLKFIKLMGSLYKKTSPNSKICKTWISHSWILISSKKLRRKKSSSVQVKRKKKRASILLHKKKNRLMKNQRTISKTSKKILKIISSTPLKKTSKIQKSLSKTPLDFNIKV